MRLVIAIGPLGGSRVTSVLFSPAAAPISAAACHKVLQSHRVHSLGLDMAITGGLHAVFKACEDDTISTDRQQVQGFLYWCPQENSNIYAYPLPWCPIVDCNTDKVIAIHSAHSEETLPDQCTAASDYAVDLFTGEYRTDIKPLDIVQPEGPSFQVKILSSERAHLHVGHPNVRCSILVFQAMLIAMRSKRFFHMPRPYLSSSVCLADPHS